MQVAAHDPQASPAEAIHEYGITLLPEDALPRADAIVAAAAHKGFKALGVDALTSKLVAGGSLVDVKSAFDAEALRQAGATVWRL